MANRGQIHQTYQSNVPNHRWDKGSLNRIINVSSVQTQPTPPVIKNSILYECYVSYSELSVLLIYALPLKLNKQCSMRSFTTILLMWLISMSLTMWGRRLLEGVRGCCVLLTSCILHQRTCSQLAYNMPCFSKYTVSTTNVCLSLKQVLPSSKRLWRVLPPLQSEFDTLRGTSWCIQVHVLNSDISTEMATKVF